MAKHTRGTRVRIKTRKIQNKNFYSPYSNETFYMKALEYKADFTLIEQIVKSLEGIQVFFRKYMIHSFHCFGLCQCFEGIRPPVEKGILSGLITMVLFVLKGGGGGGCSLRYLQLETIKIVNILNWGVTTN